MHSYKYLGVEIDDKLDWRLHTAAVYKKLNQRLFFLRKLNSFSINKIILSMFYSSVLESVLSFCLCCWGGNCSGIDKNKLNTIVKKCNKITKNNFLQINELFEKISLRKINYILKDLSHPFQIQLKESRLRKGRFLQIKTNRERYKKSFLPNAIKVLNEFS